jgi:hypothetical protein
MVPTIAMWANKGGTGKTLYSTHAAAVAAGDGNTACVVNLDVQPDAMRRAGEHRDEDDWYIDDRVQSADGYEVIYSSLRVPSSVPGADLILADLPPGGAAVRLVAPDVWVCPTGTLDAVDNLRMATPELQQQCPVIVVLLTGHDAGGAVSGRRVAEAALALPDVLVWPVAVPFSRLIAKAAAERTLVWRVSGSEGMAGPEVLGEACLGITRFAQEVAADRTTDQGRLQALTERCAASARGQVPKTLHNLNEIMSTQAVTPIRRSG